MKTILHHNHNNGTIEYTMSRTFHFEQYKNFSDDDMVTTVNFVYVVSTQSIQLRNFLCLYYTFYCRLQ